jgi:HSP20 family protein
MSQAISQKPRTRRVSPFSLTPWIPRDFLDFDNLFEAINDSSNNSLMTNFTTRMDVSETEHAIEIRMDLPGVKPEDVDITVENNMLTIRGERSEEKEEHDKKRQFHSIERRFGSFSRSVALPMSVIESEAVAEFNEGVLKVVLPKSEEVKPKKINVKKR